MAFTNIADIIIPSVFMPYALNRSTELSAFVQSGVITVDPQFVALANEGGVTANMPYFNDLVGTEEVIDDTHTVGVDNITTGQDICVKYLRQKAFGARDIAGALAGADPAKAIAELFGGWWMRADQTRLLNLLGGVFGSASMADLVHDIHHTSGGPTDANLFTGRTFIDAKQKLGDAKEMLAAIAIHSATEAWLAKQDLIDFIPDSEGKGRIKTFQGMRVIIDDGMPTATVDGDTVYTSYLFAQGAVAMGDGTNDQQPLGAMGTWRLEYSRDALAGQSAIIMRRTIVQHIRGIKWTGSSMAGTTPTNAEIAMQANWSRVYDKKKIRVIKFVHNIGA